MYKTISKFSVLVLFCLMNLSLPGCEPHRQIRTQRVECVVSGMLSKNHDCKDKTIEKHLVTVHPPSNDPKPKHFEVAFVEFDDQGLVFDKEQMRFVLDRVAVRSKVKRPFLVLVFVHGWKHNAAICDPNVSCFREMVRTAAMSPSLTTTQDTKDEDTKTDDPNWESTDVDVLGVYVSWYGHSLTALENLTFFARKQAAERVAQGQARTLFTGLLDIQRDVREQHPENPYQMRLMFVGHSFGGLILYESMMPYLLSSALQKVPDKKARPADLVVLINPAFEATRYVPLRDAATRSVDEAAASSSPLPPWPDPATCPVFVSLTSRNDYASKRAFPAGRWAGSRFDHFKNGDEERTALQTIGHYPPFKTHILAPDTLVQKELGTQQSMPVAPTPTGAGDVEECDCKAWRIGENERNDKSKAKSIAPGVVGQRKYLSTVLTKKPTDTDTPDYWVVEVDPRIIDGHSNFFTEQLRDFLVVLYNDVAECQKRR